MNAPFQPGDKIVCVNASNLPKGLHPVSVGTIYSISSIEETEDVRSGQDDWGVALTGTKTHPDLLYSAQRFRRVWSSGEAPSLSAQTRRTTRPRHEPKTT